MITELDIRQALKKILTEVDPSDINFIKIFVNPLDLASFLEGPVSARILNNDNLVTYNGYPVLTRQYLKQGEVAIMVVKDND